MIDQDPELVSFLTHAKLYHAYHTYTKFTLPNLIQVTSLRYLTQCPRNPMHIITMDVCTRYVSARFSLVSYARLRLGVLSPGEVYHPDQMKTKTIFVVGQLIYAVLWLLPTPILFHLRFLNTTFLLILVIAGIWRGGSYYIFVFSKVTFLLFCYLL